MKNIGRTEADAPDIDGNVRLPGHGGADGLAPGTVLLVEVVAADGMELVGRPSMSAAAALYFSAPLHSETFAP